MFQIPVRVYSRKTRKYRTVKARLYVVTSEIVIDESNCAGGRLHKVPPGQLVYAWFDTGYDDRKIIRVLGPWATQSRLEHPQKQAFSPGTFDIILTGTIREVVPWTPRNDNRAGKSYTCDYANNSIQEG